VVEREEEVDRLWSFVSRRLRTTVRTAATDDDRPADPRRRLDYYETARHLERIADAEGAAVDGVALTTLVAAARQCVGYTRNIEAVARYNAYRA
jgi:phosphate uptake regulator